MNGETGRPRLPRLAANTSKNSSQQFSNIPITPTDTPRVHAHLVRHGEQVSPELVRELMRELDLIACQPRPYRPTTTSPGDPGPIPDLVNRDFTADTPGQKMVGDITYIPTWEGWLSLATVIDSSHQSLHRIRYGRPSPY
jgi:transposase InsO family protein